MSISPFPEVQSHLPGKYVSILPEIHIPHSLLQLPVGREGGSAHERGVTFSETA